MEKKKITFQQVNLEWKWYGVVVVQLPQNDLRLGLSSQSFIASEY